MSRLSDRLFGNWASLTILLAMLFLPVYGPIMSYVEGDWWPVTSKVEFIDTKAVDEGTITRFSYVKNRTCELAGVVMKRGGMEVEFSPVFKSSQVAQTRLPGKNVSRLWLAAVPNFDGVELTFLHRCHPFWITVTRVYP